MHLLVTVVGLGAEDLAPPAVDVRHDVAQILLWDADVGFDDGLQEHRARVQGSLSDRHRSGDLERHVIRIDRVVFAVDQRHLDIDHGITGDHALGHVIDDALLHRGAEALGDRAPEDLVLPDETLAALGWGHLDDADSVLAVATGLLDMPALGATVARDGLAIRDAWDLGRSLHTVLALELLERDVQMYIAEPSDDQLLGLFDSLHVQCRVLFAEPCQAVGDLLLVSAGLGRDGHAVGGPGQVEWWEGSSVRDLKRVTCERVGELGRGPDVTCPYLRSRDVLLSARVEDLGKALFTAPGEVWEMGVGRDGAGDHLEVANATELIAASAEHERLDGLLRFPLGRRHELRDGRHQRSHAKELGRRAADDGGDLALENPLPQTPLDLLLAQSARVQILLEQRVVALGGGLDQLSAILVDQLLQIVRDRNLAALPVGRGHESFQVEQIDYAAEVLLRTDGQMQGKGARREVIAHRGHRAVEVRIFLVELVDHDDARLAGSVAVLPRDLRPHRELRAGAYDHHSAFRHAQSAQDLARKIEEAGRVQDVDLVAVVLD